MMVGFDAPSNGGHPNARIGTSHVEGVRALTRHCASTDSPVVLIEGVYGTDKLPLLHQVAEAHGYTFNEVPSHSLPGQTMQRRLSFPVEGASAHELADMAQRPCLTDSARKTHLLVPHVDLLDEESLTVLDLILRRGEVGVFMTSLVPSGLGYRYARVLEGGRGFRRFLRPLDHKECQQLLVENLQEPPTSALVAYLRRCTEGSSAALRRITLKAVNDRWIAVMGSRSVVRRIPLWLDIDSATAFCQRIATDLGSDALRLLQFIARQGRCELSDLLARAGASDAVFGLAEAGLLHIKESTVEIRGHSDQHDLLLGSRDSPVDPPQTAEEMLLTRLQGLGVDPQQAARASLALLERGLLEQARFVADALPPEWEAALIVEVCASVCEGAPRRALRSLSRRALRDAAAWPGQAESLTAFVQGILLDNLAPHQTDHGPFRNAIRILGLLKGESSAVELDGLIDDEDPQSFGFSAEPGDGVDLKLLETAVGLAIHAYAAALMQQAQHTERALALFERLPIERIPVIGMTWVLERIGLARLFTTPEEEVLPTSWFSDETPERGLFRVISCEVLLLLQELTCGAPTDMLSEHLEDIWAQFEGGLARGMVTRTLLEVFDFIIDGDRSEELIGPAPLAAPHSGRPFYYPWADTLIVLGRLLHCQPADLVDGLEAELAGHLKFPGARRMVIRCVILRRASDLPQRTLRELMVRGAEVGVETEVIGFAQACASSEQERIEEAVARIRLKHPAFQGLPTDAPRSSREPKLRADRLKLLSRREGEVAEQVITGAAVMQVAAALGISDRTVQTHVRNIYRKLGVNSRTELRADLLSGGEVRP